MTLLSFSTVYGNAETLTTIKICENTHQIHFGSQYITECALRRSPCQSELAELREPAIHPEGNAIHGYDGKRARPRGVFCWRAKTKIPAANNNTETHHEREQEVFYW